MVVSTDVRVARKNEFPAYAGKLIAVTAWLKLCHCATAGRIWSWPMASSAGVFNAVRTIHTNGIPKRIISAITTM